MTNNDNCFKFNIITTIARALLCVGIICYKSAQNLHSKCDHGNLKSTSYYKTVASTDNFVKLLELIEMAFTRSLNVTYNSHEAVNKSNFK